MNEYEEYISPEEVAELRRRIARCLRYQPASDYVIEMQNILRLGTQFSDGTPDNGRETFPIPESEIAE